MMRRWLVGLMVAGLLALLGCIPGLDDVIGPIVGTADGPSYILVEYQISTIALRSDIGDEPRTVSESIGSLGTVSYDPELHRVTCDTSIGDTLVQIWIFLNASEDMIDFIKVRNIHPIAGGVWMEYNFLESYSVASANIELIRDDGNEKVFRVDQDTLFVDGFCDSIMTVEWRQWRPDPPASETQLAPFYRLKDPYSTLYHDCDDAGNFVEVTLEYN